MFDESKMNNKITKLNSDKQFHSLTVVQCFKNKLFSNFKIRINFAADLKYTIIKKYFRILRGFRLRNSRGS